MSEPTPALADGDHYREMAGRLRALPRDTQSPGIRRELVEFVGRYAGIACRKLFRQQATERDHAKRQALLYKIQQLSIDRVMYAPVLDFSALMGIGPRITKHTITDVWMSPFPSYEDIEMKQ